jgi:hypothetical protein
MVVAYMVPLGLASQPTASAQPTPRADRAYIENRGQIGDQHGKPNHDVRFLITRPGLNIQLRNNGFSYDSYVVDRCELPIDSTDHMLPSKFRDRPKEEITYHFHRVDIDLVGANPKPVITATGASADYLNYYTHITEQVHGEQGATDVRGYAKVTYHDIWPGIDMEWFMDDRERPEYQFVVRPGGDVASIQWRYRGANRTELTADAIVMHVQHGPIRETLPRSYVQSTGKSVDIRYRAFGDDTYGFTMLPTDLAFADETVVIDPLPELRWGTYYGGQYDDAASDVAVSSDNSIVLAGSTTSKTNIATVDSHQPQIGGWFTSSSREDAYFAKFSAVGQRLWATYYGGSSGDWIASIAIASNGDIVVAGSTESDTGIAVAGSHQPTFSNGGRDAFLAKFSTNGVRQWSTYIGGNDYDVANAVATSSNGDIILVGKSSSDNGIATPGCHLSTTAGYDAFVAKFSASGDRRWGTYYGSATNLGLTVATAVATTSANEIVVCGQTNSTTGIATTGSHQTALGGDKDAFVAKFSADGLRLWGTYYGGSANEYVGGNGLVVTPNDDILIGGSTSSTTSIATSGTHQLALGGREEAFLARLSTTGLRKWGTYFGGVDGDYINALDVTNDGDIVAGGFTESTSAIATSGGYQPTYGGGDWLMRTGDGFLARFSATGRQQWGTYVGGGSGEALTAIAATANDDIVVAGGTDYTVPIATSGCHQPTRGGSFDAFLALFHGPQPPCTRPPITIRSDGQGGSCVGGVISFTAISDTGTLVRWALPGRGILVSGKLTDVSIPVRWSSAGTDTMRVRVMRKADTTCYRDTAIIVTVNPLPSSAINGPTTLCANGRGRYRVPFVAGRTYRWRTSVRGTMQGSASTDSIIVLWGAPGIDTVFLRETTVATGCLKDTFLLVNVEPYPNVTITGPTSLCLPDANGARYSIPQGSTGTEYTWSIDPPTMGVVVSGQPSNQISVNWTAVGNATLRLRTIGPSPAFCVVDTSYNVVIQDTLQPTVTSATGFTTCQGDSIVLDAGAGYRDYVWYVGQVVVDTGRYLRTRKAETFIVRVSSVSGCSGHSAPVTTIVHARPTAAVKESPAGTLTVKTDATSPTFQWYDAGSAPWKQLNGETRELFVPTVSGSYGVEVTNTLTGCVERSESYAITVAPPPPDLQATAVAPIVQVCAGEQAALVVRVEGGRKPYRYTWREGAMTLGSTDSTQTLVPTTSTTLTCEVTDADETRDTVEIAITVRPLPDAIAVQQDSLLEASPAAADEYIWLDSANVVIAGATEARYLPVTNGQYRVVVVVEGCRDTSDLVTFKRKRNRVVLDVSDVDFGEKLLSSLLQSGAAYSATARLRNLGDSAVRIKALITTGPFNVVTTWVGRDLQTGETTDIIVRYLPPDEGTHDGTLVVTTEDGTQVTAKLRGVTRALGIGESVSEVYLVPSRTEVAPGDTITVQLQLADIDGDTNSIPSTFNAEFDYDPRVLQPLKMRDLENWAPRRSAQRQGLFTLRIRDANDDGPVTRLGRDTLFSVSMLVKLADVDSTMLTFGGANGFVWNAIGAKAETMVRDSVVRVRVCREGDRRRLIGRRETDTISIRRLMPNPAATTVTVDLHVTTLAILEIVDVSGRIVYAADVEAGTSVVAIDISSYVTGSYTIRLHPRAMLQDLTTDSAVFVKP